MTGPSKPACPSPFPSEVQEAFRSGTRTVGEFEGLPVRYAPCHYPVLRNSRTSRPGHTYRGFGRMWELLGESELRDLQQVSRTQRGSIKLEGGGHQSLTPQLSPQAYSPGKLRGKGLRKVRHEQVNYYII